MTTVTEKYIQKAVNEAKKEIGATSLNNINIEMNMQADGATKILAKALKEQAEANALNSRAMLKLAESLKPIDVSAIKIINNKVDSLD